MSTKRTMKKAPTATAKKSAPRKMAKTPSPAKTSPTRTTKSTARDPRQLAIGAKLTRSYRGQEHVIEVLAGGFKYQGETFPSLTALAKQITGYKAISGPAFFGLWTREQAK